MVTELTSGCDSPRSRSKTLIPHSRCRSPAAEAESLHCSVFGPTTHPAGQQVLQLFPPRCSQASRETRSPLRVLGLPWGEKPKQATHLISKGAQPHWATCNQYLVFGLDPQLVTVGESRNVDSVLHHDCKSPSASPPDVKQSNVEKFPPGVFLTFCGTREVLFKEDWDQEEEQSSVSSHTFCM